MEISRLRINSQLASTFDAMSTEAFALSNALFFQNVCEKEALRLASTYHKSREPLGCVLADLLRTSLSLFLSFFSVTLIKVWPIDMNLRAK